MILSITLTLTILTASLSFIAWQIPNLKEKWTMNPYLVAHNHQYHRFITSGFVHGDFMHLLFNMLVFYSFGSVLEEHMLLYWGKTGVFVFVMLFLLSIVVSDIPSYFKEKNNPYYNSVGASGAVSAVIFALILLEPLMPIRLIFFPFFDIPGFIMGGLYLWFESYSAKNQRDNINHSAHFTGAIFGFIFMIIIRPQAVVPFFVSILNFISF